MVATFRIVLRQEEGYDVHDIREFDVALDSKFAIGRASKNTSKGYLLPAKHNVYIDSPVISREHAILTANAASGHPDVYITDTKSMHGTFVNGTPLVPNTPKLLSNGDKLQFGINVSRNESYFLAYKYLFNAELTYPEPFSRGFTVPEAESEEEDVIVQSDRGSQLNPLILDDSDAASENSDDSESQDNGEVTMAQLDEEAEQYEALFEGESFEEDGETAFASLAESDVESNVESDAESPGSVIYDDEDENIEVLEEAEEITATKQIEAALADQDRPSVTVSASVSQSPVEQASAITSHHQEFDYAIADLPFPPIALSQDLDSTPFDSAFPPPLPPRPSQKRQRVWDEVLHGDYEQWTSASPVANFGTHAPHLFQDTPQQIELPHISSFSPELAPAFKPAADRIQTPPPTLAADVISSTPPPARRTGVSITEIVDEQPLTPTSVSSRKRSADDAFEEEAEQNDEPLEMSALEAMAVDSATITENAAPAPKVAIPPSVEQIVPRSERHIAQPRSILRKALRAAKLMVPATAFGAAASIAVLTALPESFFTIA